MVIARINWMLHSAAVCAPDRHICILSFGLNSCSVLQRLGPIVATIEALRVPARGACGAPGTGKRAMVYRRTHQVVKRLAARRSAILAAARDAAAEGGMAAVQIAPVAVRANVAAGTVYRYFPSKAELISELIAEVSRDELAAIRRAADAAPGPSSALAAAVTTVAVHVLSQRKLAWGILAEPVDVDVTAPGSPAAAKSQARSQRGSTPRCAPAICRRRIRRWPPPRCWARCMNPWSGRWRRIIPDDPAKLRDAVQTVTLLALRAVGVMDARARGLVVQAVLPAKALVGA